MRATAAPALPRATHARGGDGWRGHRYILQNLPDDFDALDKEIEEMDDELDVDSVVEQVKAILPKEHRHLVVRQPLYFSDPAQVWLNPSTERCVDRC